jgi:dihydroorotate dehydrogenase electron transfer subunit
MRIEVAEVVDHTRITDVYRVLCLHSPAVAGSRIVAGQFIHVRVPRLEGSVLRRPFSIFKAGSDTLTVLYKSVGRGTRAMEDLRAGDRISIMGPLGKGFPLDDRGTLPVLVGGGYGVAPLSLLAGQLEGRGAAFIGGATADDILCVEEIENLGWSVSVATEDGSMGTKGMVTDALDSWVRRNHPARGLEFYACGPDAMLRAVWDRAGPLGYRAWLSLDRRMGCGVGACLACVLKVRRSDGGVVWARACREGPVFDAREIVWE